MLWSTRFLVAATMMALCNVAATHALAAGPRPAFTRLAQAPDGAITVADFNGDGRVDITGSEDGGNVVIYLSTPDGYRQSLVLQGNTFDRVISTAAADLDTDGHTDLLTVRWVQGARIMELAVHPGNGDGTFREPRSVSRGDNFTFVVASDFNNDTRQDVALGQEPESVLVFPGNGDFSFATQSVTTVGPFPSSAAAADFNRDGRIDLAVVSRYGFRLFVLLTQADGTFGVTEFATTSWPWEVVAADLNADGWMDLAVGASSEFPDGESPPQGFLAVHLNAGNGSFGGATVHETGLGAGAVTAGDFNGDGLTDIVTLNRSGDRFEGGLVCGYNGGSDSIAVFTGTGRGTLDPPAYFGLAEAGDKFGGAIRSLAAAHLNGDGLLDLVTAPNKVFLGRVPTANRAPTVFAWEHQPQFDGYIRLASEARDADFDLLTYRWTDAAGAVVGGTLERTCIEAPLTAGEHTYTLTVTDDQGASAVARVAVIVAEADSPRVSFNQDEVSIPGATPYQITWNAAPADETMPIGRFDLFTSTDGTTFTAIAECSALAGSARACTWQRPGPSGNVILRIVARGTNGRIAGAHMRAIVQDATWVAPPAPWQSTDIGAVGPAGSAEYWPARDLFRVSGSGADIWGTADAFHYMYQPLPFDGDLTVHVTAVNGPHVWTKVGVMIRQALAPGSPHRSLFVTPGKGIAYQGRDTTGGTSFHQSASLDSAPRWLKITRRSRVTRVFHSADGVNWQTVAESVFVDGPLYIGIAVASHDNTTLATGVFDSVNVVLYPRNTPPAVRITTPINGATFTAPADVMLVADATDADQGVRRVEFQHEVSGGWSLLARLEAEPWSFVWPDLPAGTYTVRAVATDLGDAETISAPVTFTVAERPAQEWTSQDIGRVGVAGRFADGQSVTIEGSGADIWGTEDAFHYAWRDMSGDFQIVAHVASIENVHVWTKAGLMIRAHTGASSPHVSLFATPGRGIAFQRRLTEGALSTHNDVGAGSAPIWLKLARIGNTFIAYRSPNGIAWHLVASQTLTLPAALKVGLAVTSHDNTRLATATFSNVSVSALPPWISRDIGNVGIAGTTDGQDPLTVEASGADIWGTADAFRFVYRPWTGDGEVVTRVIAVENTHVWAKAGVMIRGSLDANAAHVSLFVTPGKGIALQSRAAPGDLSTHTAAGTATQLYWVRLMRRGTTITGFTSADGATWTSVGSRSIAFGDTIYVGLALTSHNDAALATATFQSTEVRR